MNEQPPTFRHVQTKYAIVKDIGEYTEEQFDQTQYNTIYGLGGIGLYTG